MGILLVKKKKIEKEMEIKGFYKAKKKKELTEKQEKEYKKLKEQIKKVQKDAKKLMEELKKFKQEKAVSAASVYIQFQSKNGKKKFIQAFQKNKC